MDWNATAAAAMALLAGKFGEGLSGEAGKAAWGLAARVRGRIVRQFGDDPNTRGTLERLESGDAAAAAAVEQRIIEAAESDPVFGSDLAALLQRVRRDSDGTILIAEARDHAKQINITGDNHGPIRL